MTSDIITIDSQFHGLTQALEQTDKTAQFRGLTPTQTKRLQLITEELVGMLQMLNTHLDASFWIESEGMQFTLNLTAKTIMDKQTRQALLAASKSHTNDAAVSFLSRVRDAFEEALLAEAPLPAEGFSDLSAKDQEDLAGRSIYTDDWDGYEQSVLARLADDIRIGIRGNNVHMKVLTHC